LLSIRFRVSVCSNIVKASKQLDEMYRKARAEALQIEAARQEAKRLILRRKHELAELAQEAAGKSSRR
jgi:hypothetical protein